jgi:signal transduction histidine kinase
LKNIPFKYFLLALIVIIECYFYIYGYRHSNYDEIDWENRDNNFVVSEVEKGSNAEIAGLKKDDIILSVQGRKIIEYNLLLLCDQFKPGSTVNFDILRNGSEKVIPIKFKTEWERNKSFFYLYYSLIAVVFLIGLFILIKRPGDKTARIFFIFTQIFAICLNSDLFVTGNFGWIRTAVFFSAFPFLGTVITHFFFYFPQKNKLVIRYKSILKVIYIIPVLISSFLVFSLCQFYLHMNESTDNLVILSIQTGLGWMGLTLFAAIIISLHNFFTIKEVVAHNQLRWILIGVMFGLLPEAFFGIGMNPTWHFDEIIPHSNQIIWAFGAIILLLCTSFAIFRYRIWDIEIIIKKSLLYSSLTGVLIGGYFLLYRLSGLIVEQNSGVSQIIGIIFSALIFIPSREFLQRRIDKLFHREKYDPTTAALNFEHKLIGKYDFNILIEEICKEIDDIFHFASFAFAIKEKQNNYMVICGLGKAKHYEGERISFEVDLGQSGKISQITAISDIKNQSPFFESINAELVTQVKYEKKLFGYFICGYKLSERIYTMQDIEMLNLLANRTATILQISSLYKSELERQTAVDKERLRISKDMHDEVGSSLTKIAILSELIQNEMDNRNKTVTDLNKISEISRNVIDNISEIIWAINPKNDRLDNLAAYIREYVYEFLEGTKINCHFDFMENYPAVNLSAEVRRNIFLVIKESLNNMVKHSCATEASLNLFYDEPDLQVILKDNGKGFMSEKISGFGNGLSNMARRIEDIGGKFNLTSSPGKGVIIEIHLKLAGNQ